MSRIGSGIARRLLLVVVVLIVAVLGLVGRLVDLQLVHHQDYREQAEAEHVSSVDILPRRGAILDRNGYPLAASVDTYDVLVDKHVWGDPDSTRRSAEKLADVINRPTDDILADLDESISREVVVTRGLDYQASITVEDLGLSGVRLMRSSRRVYPEGNMAPALLGFLGRENSGLAGLELDYNRILGGAAGALVYERDGQGNINPLADQKSVPADPGADIVLTIDRYAQYLVERELDATIEKHKASGGTIIIMAPRTGAILAMASRPSFDVTHLDFSDVDTADFYRNLAVTDMYEPGSVFKTITMSAALNEGLVSPGSTYVDEGVVHASGWAITNWDLGAHGVQTATQILVRSLNTGAVWLSQMLGPDRFYDYVQRFGFGQLTNVGLSGESPGQVRTPTDDAWSEVDGATNSFGQGINVTPLQLITAISAIANDGQFMQPYVVQEIRSDGQSQVTQPVTVRQAITPETANTITDMMESVVDGITAVYSIEVPGYRVAGKTGTASISIPGGYKPDSYIASFAGFVPSDDPALAILVKIDEPKDVPWGSAVSAPVFARLSSALLPYLKVLPDSPALVQGNPPE